MLRLFVGIALPPETKLRLSPLYGGIPGARWVDPANYHVTLRFIGEVDGSDARALDDFFFLLQIKTLHPYAAALLVGQLVG